MKYFVAEGREATGPFSIEELRQKNLQPSTLVWHDRLPEWVRADEIDEIRREVLGIPPIAPPSAFGQTPEPAQMYNQSNSGPNVPPVNGYAANRFGNQGYANQYDAERRDIPPCPPNYLPWAIGVTLCCCMILGVIAIIYSTKVNSLYSQGRYDEAYQASRTTKNLIIWGVVAGLITNAVAAVFSSMGNFAYGVWDY